MKSPKKKMQEKPLSQLDDIETIDLNITGENGITASDFSTIDLSGAAGQSSFAFDSMNYDTISYNGGNISTISIPTGAYGSGGSGGLGSQYTFTTSGTGGGGGGGSGYVLSTGTGTNSYTWNSITDPSVHISQNGIDMPKDADIKIGDRSLKEFMTKMEERMAILVPDPKKLEKFEALKKAYEHYKLMERLCQTDDEKDI